MNRFENARRLLVGGTFVAVAALAGCSSDPTNPADPFATGAPDGSIGGPGTGFDPDGGVDGDMTDGVVPIDGSCGGTQVQATAREANLLLVIDQSASMLQTPAGFPMRKWDALKVALGRALRPAANKLALGMELFPDDPAGTIGIPCTNNCCAMPSGEAAITVPIERGPSAFDRIMGAVDATSPGGATPTADALDRALRYFTTGAGRALSGDKYVLLATDGGPNCNTSLTCGADRCTTNIDGSCPAGENCCDPSKTRISCLDDARVIAKLNALRGAGVRTFVVGIPGTEAYEASLDAFAEAGGFPNPTGPRKYYKVEAKGGVNALVGVFEQITGALITSCRLQLSSPPPNATLVNVYVDGVPVPQSGPDGWDLDMSTNPPTIVLRGATCASIEGVGVRSISVTYGCPTVR